MMALQGFSAILAVTAVVMTSSYALSAVTKTVYLREHSRIGFVVARTARMLNLPSASSTFQLFDEKLSSSSLNPQTVQQRHRWMKLNNRTGVVTLQRRLDREEICGDAEKCFITITVFVVGLQQLINIDVIIRDINDNPPVFPSQHITLSIPENSKFGDVINLDQYLAQDADIGNNSKITYTISPNHFFEVEQYEDEAKTSQLQLKVIGNLDYEKTSLVRLKLTATDGGIPQLSSHVKIQISIIDVNDNNPIFDKLEYSVELEENFSPGKVIAHVVAHDADTGSSGLIRYSISRRNKHVARYLVDINARTGDVTLKQNLDRELRESLDILIEARDSVITNQRVGRTRLLIRVKDVNDNAPVIAINFITIANGNTVYVDETSPPGTYIAHVTAKDDDIGLNGEVELSIAVSATPNTQEKALNATFALTKDGFLRIEQDLDREIQDTFNVVVRACDHGLPSLCSNENISIVLLDVNEHTPKLECPKKKITTSEDTAVGTILTTLKAFDRDSLNTPALMKNENGELVPSTYGDVTYYIISGDAPFSIERNSGILRVSRGLDREFKENFQIRVIARDGSLPIGRTISCTLQIKITDVNDVSPVFINPAEDKSTLYATILRDNIIARIQAVDYDEGINGQVEYDIISEDRVMRSRDQKDSLFLLNPKSGDLKLNFSITNLEQFLGMHTIKVKAKDMAPHRPLSSVRDIDIVITDLLHLPTNSPNSIKAGPPSAYLVKIIAVPIASFILLVLLIFLAIVIFRIRRNNKRMRTYTCRKGPGDSDEWGQASVVSMRSLGPRRALSKDTSVGNGSDLWSHSTNKRSKTELVLDESTLIFPNKPANDAIVTSQYNSTLRSLGQQSLANSALSDVSKQDIALEKKKPVYRPTVYSHDGDSGRGDSDPDVACSEVNCEQGYSKLSSTSRKSSKEESSILHSRCTPQCITYGHSDSCWMPLLEQASSPCRSPRRDNYPMNSPLYVELSPVKARPLYTDHTDHPNLETIHERIPLRPYWSYPANDLSSIYSNVIFDPLRQIDPYHKRVLHNQTPATYSSRRLVNQSPTRLSPISSVSSPCKSPKYSYFYEDGPSQCSHRRDVTTNEVASRSVTSLVTSPSTHHPPGFTRSASAEQLIDQLHDATKSPKRGFNPNSENNDKSDMYGNVSMRETKEIVENIERLLDS